MQRNLLRVSMRTAATGRSASTPLRLTLLLDNSGSMERADRSNESRVSPSRTSRQADLPELTRKERGAAYSHSVRGACQQRVVQFIPVRKIDLGLALLDCPDIQTASATAGMPSAQRQPLDATALQQARRQMLGRVGRLCSAFLVVTKLSSLHDDTLLSILETLRDTMPGVRRILCVNKVKARYAPTVVDEQAQVLVDQFQIDRDLAACPHRTISQLPRGTR